MPRERTGKSSKKGDHISYNWTVRKRKIKGVEREVRVRCRKGKLEVQVIEFKIKPKVKPKLRKKIKEKPKLEPKPRKKIVKLKPKVKVKRKPRLREKIKEIPKKPRKKVKIKPEKEPKPKSKPKPKPIIIKPKPKPKPKRKKEPTPARIIKLLALDNKQYQLFKKEELYHKIKNTKDFELIMLQVYNDHYASREAKTLENKHFREFMENKYLDLIDRRKHAWESKRKRALRKESKRTGFKNLSYMMKLKHIDKWLVKNDFDIEGTELQMIIKGNPEFELDELKQEIMKHLATTDFSFYEKFADSTDPDIRQGLREFERDIINQEIGYMYAPQSRYDVLNSMSMRELRDQCIGSQYAGYSKFTKKDDLIKFIIKCEKKGDKKIKPKFLKIHRSQRYYQLKRLTKRQMIEKAIREDHIYPAWVISPKYWTKDDLIYWMIHYEKEYKKKRRIEKASIKQPPGAYPIMKKTPSDNIIKSFKELAKNPREYSIGIDFERKLIHPQTIVALEGGESETIRFEDFEMFGHTHPNSHYAAPSTQDLRGIELFKPEFVVAGLSGKTMIVNIENYAQYKKWKKANEDRRIHTNPISREILEKKYGVNIAKKYLNGSAILRDKKGRAIFLKETGIRAYPYKKGMTIEMIDDPTFEKKIPTISSKLLEKYHMSKPQSDEWSEWVKMKPMELRRHLNSLTVEELKQKSNLSKIQKYKRKSRIINVLTREIEYLKYMSQFGRRR